MSQIEDFWNFGSQTGVVCKYAERSANFDTIRRQVALQCATGAHFRPETTRCCFRVFSTLIAHGTKTRRAAVLIFGTVVERRTLYSNWSNVQRTLTHYAARWRQRSELFVNWQI